jgi:hypothetical protein
VAGRRFAPLMNIGEGGEGAIKKPIANKDFLSYGLLLFICYLSKSAATAVLGKY